MLVLVCDNLSSCVGPLGRRESGVRAAKRKEEEEEESKQEVKACASHRKVSPSQRAPWLVFFQAPFSTLSLR